MVFAKGDKVFRFKRDRGLVLATLPRLHCLFLAMKHFNFFTAVWYMYLSSISKNNFLITFNDFLLFHERSAIASMSKNEFDWKEIDLLFCISLGDFLTAVWLVFIFVAITEVIVAGLPLATVDVVLSFASTGEVVLVG